MKIEFDSQFRKEQMVMTNKARTEVMSLHWQNICLTLNGRGPSNRLTRNRWSEATAVAAAIKQVSWLVRDFKFNSERKRGKGGKLGRKQATAAATATAGYPQGAGE